MKKKRPNSSWRGRYPMLLVLRLALIFALEKEEDVWPTNNWANLKTDEGYFA